MTDYEVVSKLRMIALDEQVQRRWRREHRLGLVWSWVKGWTVPLACVGMAIYAVWEVLR